MWNWLTTLLTTEYSIPGWKVIMWWIDTILAFAVMLPIIACLIFGGSVAFESAGLLPRLKELNFTWLLGLPSTILQLLSLILMESLILTIAAGLVLAIYLIHLHQTQKKRLTEYGRRVIPWLSCQLGRVSHSVKKLLKFG